MNVIIFETWVSTWELWDFRQDRQACCWKTNAYFTPPTQTRLSCLVGGVNRIGDKSRLFSVVLTAFQDWTNQFRNLLSPTVSTCRQFCSHRRHGQDITVLLEVWSGHYSALIIAIQMMMLNDIIEIWTDLFFRRNNPATLVQSLHDIRRRIFISELHTVIVQHCTNNTFHLITRCLDIYIK